MERWSIEEVRNRPDVLQAVVALLFQLADDDFIIGYRDQEWLGLAPHIEEDVAFGSIGQEEIGHAALYYGILESLGQGRADDLASLRDSGERQNSVLLEQPNGPGDHIENPHYDWAFTIVRHYLHDLWEIARLEALRESRFGPLSDVASKILGEKRYHRAHQELWLKTMSSHDSSSHERLQQALDEAGQWAGDLCSWGSVSEILNDEGIVPGLSTLAGLYRAEIDQFFESLGLHLGDWKAPFNGRLFEHSAVLGTALSYLSEVYRLDPDAKW